MYGLWQTKSMLIFIFFVQSITIRTNMVDSKSFLRKALNVLFWLILLKLSRISTCTLSDSFSSNNSRILGFWNTVFYLSINVTLFANFYILWSIEVFGQVVKNIDQNVKEGFKNLEGKHIWLISALSRLL